jgi:hypothetical protein
LPARIRAVLQCPFSSFHSLFVFAEGAACSNQKQAEVHPCTLGCPSR